MGKQAGFTDVDFFCQTSGKHYDVRPGLEGGKFMIAVFSKGVMGTLDFRNKGAYSTQRKCSISLIFAEFLRVSYHI